MKKVLSIVLSLSMVLGSFGLAFAATPNVASKFSDVNGKNCEEAVKVLSDLSVVTGYDDGTYKPENIVTRAEMAVLVVNALGLQNYVTTTAKSTFKDMDGYGWAEGYIAYAQQLGIISGYGDGTFKPGKTVSYDEAATMLVAALGYTPASLQGTWPANYVTKAKSLGILDGVKAGADGANRGDTAIMLYQTLDQKIGTVNKDNVWNENQGKQIADPLNENDSRKINAGDKMIYRLGADPEDTQIDSVVTGDEDANINLRPYVGMCATKYYKDGKVIAITDIQSTFIDGTFAKTATTGSAISKFTADADDVEYTIDLSSATQSSHNYKSWDQVQYFYNGQNLTRSQMQGKIADLAFNDKDGVVPSLTDDLDATIAVKDNGKTIKTLYSISIWDHSAQGADAKVNDSDINAIKNDKTLLGEDFTTLKDGSIDMNSFDLIGVPRLDKIAKDNVVFVYAKKDNGDITRIEVSQDTVQGEITKVNSGGDKYTIDGKTYTVTTGKSFDYNAGDTIKAYLDPKGKIYAVDDVSSTANNYAIVMKAPDQSGQGFDSDTYKVKLFTKDGNATTFEFKDKDAYKETLVDPKGALTGPSKFADGDLVTYDVNSAGKITKLMKKTEGHFSGRVNNGVVGGKQLADNAVIFTVSGTGNVVNDWDFDVTSAKNIDKDQDITSSTSPSIAGAYALNSGKNKVTALIIDSSASGASNSYGFVESISSGKNSKGDQVKLITGVVDGKALKDVMTDSNTAYGATNADGKVISNAMMRFEFNGDVITGIKQMTSFLDYDAFPSSDQITKDIVKIYKHGNWQEVYATDNNDLQVGAPGQTPTKESPLDAQYISVKGAKAYQAALDSDGKLDSWKVGNPSNINRGDNVVLFQTSKNSSAPDVIVYVKKADLPINSDFDFSKVDVNNTGSTTPQPPTFDPTKVTLNDKGFTTTAYDVTAAGIGANVAKVTVNEFTYDATAKQYTIKFTPAITATDKAANFTLEAKDATFIDNTGKSSVGKYESGSLMNGDTAQRVITVSSVTTDKITATLNVQDLITVAFDQASTGGQAATEPSGFTATVQNGGSDAVKSGTLHFAKNGTSEVTLKLTGTSALTGEYPISLTGKVNGGNTVALGEVKVKLTKSGTIATGDATQKITLTDSSANITDLKVVIGDPVQTVTIKAGMFSLDNGIKITVEKQDVTGIAGGKAVVNFKYLNATTSSVDGQFGLKPAAGAVVPVSFTADPKLSETAVEQTGTFEFTMPADAAVAGDYTPQKAIS